MLQNAYLLAKIGADTAENEQHFAEILPKIGRADRAPRVLAEPDCVPESAGAWQQEAYRRYADDRKSRVPPGINNWTGHY